MIDGWGITYNIGDDGLGTIGVGGYNGLILGTTGTEGDDDLLVETTGDLGWLLIPLT